jgi:GNAT superfamily N-acetyltransferase
MGCAALDVYVEAFVARCLAARPSVDAMIHEPGIHGLLPDTDDGRTRLLVTDDRARDRLSALLGDARAGMITVCAAAVQCAGIVETDPGWRAGTATAMICRDLQTVQAPPLPSRLTLRPVRRLAHDPPGGVPLTQAVAAACRADPESTDAQALADHLRSLPRAFALWAAVDHGDTVRGTSGSAAIGATASVIFVNTDPDWRRRGIARAMTAIALRAAQHAGAGYAGLDASDEGRQLYLSLGFEAASLVRRFRPPT